MTDEQGKDADDVIALPAPAVNSSFSVEAALLSRRSVRTFNQLALSLDIIGQMVWSAQGVTSSRGGRTAPSAGALYPLEINLLIGNVISAPAGLYRYRPADHTLWLRRSGDLRNQLRQVALQQQEIADASAVLIISAVITRTARKYGNRAERYVHMEAGHAAQNVYLQAAALGLGTVVIGAFDDDAVKKLLGFDLEEAPIALMPIGYPN